VRVLVLALLALALAAPAAQAHATLETTAPQRGATVHAQPRQVVFGFNEPVEGTFGAVRVFDARARRVDDNHVSHPAGVGSKLAVGLKPNLPRARTPRRTG
jgi:copper transport protein